MRPSDQKLSSPILFNAFRLLCICLVANCFLTTPIKVFKENVHEADSLSIQFQDFSPAYAAFEDEYLFENEVTDSLPLLAGTSEHFFLENSVDKNILTPQNIHPMSFVIHNVESEDFPFYDEEVVQEDLLASNITPIQPFKIKPAQKRYSTPPQNNDQQKDIIASPTVPQFVLSMGPMVASAITPESNSSSWQPASQLAPQRSHVDHSNGSQFDEYGYKRPKPKNNPVSVGGELQLVGGLAFLGALEVSWIVAGEEISRGQISLEEGRYNIDIQGLTGHIVVSLYDENEFLMGEGSANLTELSLDANFDPKNLPIAVKDINITLAGKVKSVYSIGTDTDHAIEGAEVALYGIDVATQTNAKGEYHFNEWKNADSKTLAQASKDGYRDSIFLLDSNQTQDVILMTDSYASAFYSHLEKSGFEPEIANDGMIFGTIHRQKEDGGGFRAEVDGYPSIYFQYYRATEGQIETDDSGQFAIVGLADGDHVLRIYDGKTLVDRRILAVERGKVSPIEIRLQPQTKVLSFIDPLFNDPLPETGTRFFDGEYLLSDDPGHTASSLTRGADPALLEFAFEDGQEHNVFISRNDRFQKVPVINQAWFLELKEKMELNPTMGIAFGFIDTQRPFRIVVAEKAPRKTLYFDRKGRILTEPGNDMVGFLLIGIDEGLHTIMIESPEGDELYLTDLVYNDHESHSVVFHSL